jgi:hypothetical protein
MERKHFLKNGLAALGLAAIAPLANACKKGNQYHLSPVGSFRD